MIRVACYITVTGVVIVECRVKAEREREREKCVLFNSIASVVDEGLSALHICGVIMAWENRRIRYVYYL
jgi:hypothetical protein